MIVLAGPGADSADYALVAIADLKAYIRDDGLTGGGEDAFLGRIADGINRAAWRHMNRRFLLDTTEWEVVLDGPGVNALFLPERPLVSVQDVSIGFFEGSTWSEVENVPATDYVLDKRAGKLLRLPWGWPYGTHRIKAKFNAGLAATPPDLLHELTKWGAVIFDRIVAGRLDLTSVAHEAETTTYLFDEVPAELRGAFAAYAKKDWS